VVRSPHDDKVWLSGVSSLRQLPEGVDAVVSLCRLGVDDLPAAAVQAQNHVEVWLVDDARPERNPHLDYVLTEAAEAIRELRAEGKTVLLHCVQAQSRTPTVAALYGAQVTGRSPRSCLADIQRVLPTAQPNSGMLAALDRLA
jgi:protein-tyrosine phosphatase